MAKKTTRPASKSKLPIKQTANVVIHTRVPEVQLKKLRRNNVDIPALVRQTFDKACESLRD